LSFEKDINFLPMELFSSRGSSREGIVPWGITTYVSPRICFPP
jgi:hypothetical protein